MRSASRLVALLPVLVLAPACGGAAPPPPPPPVTQPTVVQVTPTVAPSTPRPFDPLDAGLTPAGMTALCDDHLAAAGKLADGIRALAGTPADKLTYETTLGRFDDIALETRDAAELPHLMALAHPDADVRKAAEPCDTKVQSFMTALYLDPGIATVLKAYGAAGGTSLQGEKARLLSDTLRDFRRNGSELSADQQKTLAGLNTELTDLGQKFQVAIGAETGKLALDPKQLAGLPAEYVAKHPAKDGKVTVTTDYPDYFPFITYAKDRKAALDLYVLFTNRGGDGNVKLLDRILMLRGQKAHLLGYKTWADYAIEPRMAKTPDAVRAFLEQVRAAVKKPAEIELAELRKEHVKLGGKASDVLPPPDRYYLEDRVRESKYKLDSKELSSYFEVSAVITGLLDVASTMYGLTFTKVDEKTWHPDVVVYAVRDKDGPLGKVYLDLYSRPDKYKHAAMFSLRTAKRLADGSWQMPEAGLECNFPKPEAGGPPALMSHEDVLTFFHEFGHVLHHLLTKSELATYSGAGTVLDFVEAPSQMFEEWTWSREVLDRFAKHYKTGAKIPDALFDAMQKSRSFGRALATERQLFLALTDLEFHAREPGFDTTKVLQQVEDSTDPFKWVPGTHFQSSFGHLIEYDAGYYGYQWALSLSRDVLTRFQKEGLMNPATAQAWRDDVLSKGGGVDEKTMVATFLGRPPSNDAYIGFLGGK